MIRRVVLSLFAFAVLFSCFADDPLFFYLETPNGSFHTYVYPPLPSDGFFAGLVDVEGDGSCYASPDWMTVATSLSPSAYFADLDHATQYGYSDYLPFSDDPAYSSPIPSGPPSGGGGSPSGGGGEGGFDPVGSLSDLSSFASGLSTAAFGLLGAASVVCGSYLVMRKVRDSSKRV